MRLRKRDRSDENQLLREQIVVLSSGDFSYRRGRGPCRVVRRRLTLCSVTAVQDSEGASEASGGNLLLLADDDGRPNGQTDDGERAERGMLHVPCWHDRSPLSLSLFRRR